MLKVREITVPIRTEIIESRTLVRLAKQLERIADALERQNAGEHTIEGCVEAARIRNGIISTD